MEHEVPDGELEAIRAFYAGYDGLREVARNLSTMAQLPPGASLGQVIDAVNRIHACLTAAVCDTVVAHIAQAAAAESRLAEQTASA